MSAVLMFYVVGLSLLFAFGAWLDRPKKGVRDGEILPVQSASDRLEREISQGDPEHRSTS